MPIPQLPSMGQDWIPHRWTLTHMKVPVDPRDFNIPETGKSYDILTLDEYFQCFYKVIIGISKLGFIRLGLWLVIWFVVCLHRGLQNFSPFLFLFCSTMLFSPQAQSYWGQEIMSIRTAPTVSCSKPFISRLDCLALCYSNRKQQTRLAVLEFLIACEVWQGLMASKCFFFFSWGSRN